jgi:hypothetical protein
MKWRHEKIETRRARRQGGQRRKERQLAIFKQQLTLSA